MSGLGNVWRKASFSGGGGCVEVRRVGQDVQVRDTKDRPGAVLHFTEQEWTAFLAGVRAGEFDLADRAS